MSTKCEELERRLLDYFADTWTAQGEDVYNFVDGLDPGHIFDMFKDTDCNMYYGSDMGDTTQYVISMFLHDKGVELEDDLEDITDNLIWDIDNINSSYFANYRR